MEKQVKILEEYITLLMLLLGLINNGGASGVYQGATSWSSQAAFALPTILSDTTFYIGFNWINDASGGASPAFGIDNIDIEGTIKVATPPQAPTLGIFSEDFSSGSLPSGWTNTDLSGNSAGLWSFNNPGARTINTTTNAKGFAIFDSDDIGQDNKAENADLITPAFDCSSYAIVTLQLEHYFRFYANSDYRVSVSGDNGSNYTTLVFDSAETANAATLNFDISSYAAGKSQVRLKFSYKGDWSYYWAIDDILVEGQIADSAVWTGAIDTDWNTAGNWSTNNIPTSATAILIPASASNMPTVPAAAGAGCFNMTIETGATLTVETDSTQGGNLTITGDLFCNGTIVHSGSAYVRLSGSGKYISGDFTYGSNNKQWQFESGSDYLLNGDFTTYGVKVQSDAVLDLNGHILSVFSLQQLGSLTIGSGTLEIAGSGTILTDAGFDSGTGTVHFNSGGTTWSSKGTVSQTVPSVSYYDLQIRTNNGYTVTLGNTSSFTVLNDLTITNPGAKGGVITTGSDGLIAGDLILGDGSNSGFTLNVGHRISGAGNASSLIFTGSALDNQINITYTNTTLAAIDNFDGGNSMTYPVSYAGTGTQMVIPVTYDNLTIAGTGTKALGNDITVNGNLQLSSGTLTTTVSMVSEKASLSNDVFVNFLNGGVATGNTAPTLASLAANGSSMTVTVPAAYSSYSISGCSVSITHTYNADLDVYLVSPNGTVYTLSTDNGGSGDNYDNVYFVDGGAAANTGNVTLTGNYAPEGFTFASIGGTANGVWTLYAVDDATGDDGTITDFKIQLRSTATYGNINLAGNWINSGGTFTPSNGVVTFSGASQQSVTANSQSFYSVTVNGAGGLLLNDNATITNELTLTTGVISTGANRVIMTSTTSANLSGHSSSSFVNGTLRRYVASNTSTYAFPVGNGVAPGNYKLATMTNNLLVGITYIDASFGALANHNDLDLSVTEGGTSYSRINPAGVWTIEPNSQPISGTYSMSLYTAGFNGLVDNEFVILKRPVGSISGADWSTGGGLLDVLGGTGRLVSNGFALRSGLTSFSEFGVGDGSSGGGPLPIELINFDAKLNDRAEVELNWATAIEINNDYFTIERSDDGTIFEPILEVAGAGNSTVMRTYKDVDQDPLLGISYYRLKQTDFDGTSTYSQIRSVSLVRSKVEPSMVVYPNPSEGNIKVKSSGIEGMVAIMITDIQGKTIYLQHEMIHEGESPISLELKDKLNTGYYQLIMIGENFQLVEKIIIQ
jgi:subtilisin-like proprotein convertase family protein